MSQRTVVVVVLNLVAVFNIVFAAPSEPCFPPTYTCQGDILTIRGPVVASSDIATKFLCPNASHVSVKATKIFYVNADILPTSNIRSLDIATKRFVVTLENSTIALTGIRGSDGSIDQPDGTSGGSGGNFYLIADEIENVGNLTVNLNGGDGGNGKNGVTASNEIPSFPEKIDIEMEYSNSYIPDTDYVLTTKIRNEIAEKNFANSSMIKYDYALFPLYGLPSASSNFIFGHKYKVLPSKCCGPSEPGGKGGVGGQPGTFTILLQDKMYTNYGENLPNLVANAGIDGSVGIDGSRCSTLSKNILVFGAFFYNNQKIALKVLSDGTSNVAC